MPQYLRLDSNHRQEAYETPTLPLSYADKKRTSPPSLQAKTDATLSTGVEPILSRFSSWHAWIRTMITRLTASRLAVRRHAIVSRPLFKDSGLPASSGASGIRTHNLHRAKVLLSQLELQPHIMVAFGKPVRQGSDRDVLDCNLE